MTKVTQYRPEDYIDTPEDVDAFLDEAIKCYQDEGCRRASVFYLSEVVSVVLKSKGFEEMT